MVTVRFYDWPEFLATLKATPPEDRTVQLALTVRHDSHEVQHVMLLCGCRSQATPTECIQCLGIKPTDPKSERATAITQLVDERKRMLESLGFVVQSRRYVSPSANGGEPAE